MAVSKPVAAIIAASLQTLILLYTIPHKLPQQPLTLLFSSLLALNFTALGIYKLWIYPYALSPLRHLPGPNGGGYPILGNTPTMFEKPPGQSFTKWMTTIKNDGLIHFRGLFNRDILLVTSPAALAEILVAKTYMFEKPSNGRDVLREVLGDGLVVVEGDAHKFQRKNIMPSFSFRHIKDLYPMMWGKAVQLADRVEAHFEGQKSITVNIVDWATKATLDMIGVAGMGRDFNSLVHEEDELAYLYNLIGTPSPFKMLWFAVNFLFGPKIVRKIPIPINRYAKKFLARLREISRQLVRDKKDAIKKNGDDHFDILSVLIKTQNFSDDELVDQMLTFLGAGHDTTSLAFTWTCYELAKNQAVQDRLREELLSVKDDLFAGKDDDGNLATKLESLPYLNGVFHETLRLFPTVPMTQRVCVAETTVAGVKIPPGTTFVFSMVAVNRSKDFWGPDASEFKPERWIDADTGKPNNHGGALSSYSLLTFLAGPRSCIGQNFARAEGRCLLAAWILRFKMELCHAGYEPLAAGAVTMKPVGGMQLKLTQVAENA